MDDLEVRVGRLENKVIELEAGVRKIECRLNEVLIFLEQLDGRVNGLMARTQPSFTSIQVSVWIGIIGGAVGYKLLFG